MNSFNFDLPMIASLSKKTKLDVIIVDNFNLFFSIINFNMNSSVCKKISLSKIVNNG